MSTRAVVIVAAGSGTRMGQPNKALLPIGGEPAISHSIRAAAASQDVGVIVIVTRDDLLPEMAQIASETGIEQLVSVVVGGDTRSASVTNGVRKVAELGFELVAVHDAARPLVTPSDFERVFARAQECGAAIVAVPVTDTLKRVVGDALIETTVDRTGLWAAQTPQAFRTVELLAALEDAVASDVAATDEASLYEALGRPVAVVQGDTTNFKLTWPGDEDLATFLIERWRQREGTTR